MRRRTASATALTIGLAIAVVTAHVHRSTAQQTPAASTAAKTLEPIMTAIGKGQFDDAVGLMDGLKSNADQKQAARSALGAVRDAQLGNWQGYEVANTVTFSTRLQTLDVLGYYDLQPVLFRFQMYEPADNGPWQVLELKVDGNLVTATQTLRDDAPDLGRPASAPSRGWGAPPPPPAALSCLRMAFYTDRDRSVRTSRFGRADAHGTLHTVSLRFPRRYVVARASSPRFFTQVKNSGTARAGSPCHGRCWRGNQSESVLYGSG